MPELARFGHMFSTAAQSIGEWMTSPADTLGKMPPTDDSSLPESPVDQPEVV